MRIRATLASRITWKQLEELKEREALCLSEIVSRELSRLISNPPKGNQKATEIKDEPTTHK